LVEDDADCANLVTTAAELANVPFRFEFVWNGIEALEYLRQSDSDSNAPKPGFVLLDLNLPLLSGRDVLSAMRSDATLKSIPVVLLTTTDSHGDLKREFGLADHCCYTKPDRFQGYIDLLGKLERLYNEGCLSPSN
jgi:CheY-like chemotaxis protein